MRCTNRAIAALTLACAIFTDVAIAMSHHDVPNFRNARFRAPPQGDTDAAATVYNSTFEQLIDHENPSLGTFSQFYYYSTEFYKGPGSPVVSSIASGGDEMHAK